MQVFGPGTWTVCRLAPKKALRISVVRWGKMWTPPVSLARFEAETEVALGHAVFGSPSFVVDGEMLWGDDRLEEAIQWAQGQHALQIAHDK